MIAEAIELDALAIDPRPCEHCGLTLDHHDMVDHGEGPEFYCREIALEELTLPELERRAELIRQIEVAEIFARLEAMDNPERRPPPRAVPKPYQTPQSTIDAFWYVCRLGDADHLMRWLEQHPRDAARLQKIWEAKHAIA